MSSGWEEFFKQAELDRIEAQSATKRKITTELFIFPLEEDYIAYTPFPRIAMRINRAAVELLAKMQAGESFLLTPTEFHFLEILEGYGIVNGELDTRPAQPVDGIDRPNGVILFPTFECNLRCKYCYSFGGEQPAHMPWEIAKAAIDFAAQNAVERGISRFNVDFHGGGEPTRNWELMVKCRKYALETAERYGLQTSSTLVSNCVLSQAQLEWIVDNIKYVSASLDGPPDIHNSQRPLANGKPSYDFVAASLRYFDEVDYSYGIRTTITTDSVRRMSEIVAHFCENFGTRQIHFEPLFECGRCTVNALTAPDKQIFVDEFRRASETADMYGATLYYSGARLGNLTSTFCGGLGRNFVVLPDGEVTACNEVCRNTDPRWETFHYGYYDKEAGRFVLDVNRQQYLASRQVQTMPFCTHCFLKWHCAGECPVKGILRSGDLFVPDKDRCWINQELVKGMLVQVLIGKRVKGKNEIKVTELISYIASDDNAPQIKRAVRVDLAIEEPWAKSQRSNR